MSLRARSGTGLWGQWGVALPSQPQIPNEEPSASPSCVAFLSVRGCDTSVCSGHLSLTVRELPLPAVPPAPTAPELMGRGVWKAGELVEVNAHSRHKSLNSVRIAESVLQNPCVFLT